MPACLAHDIDFHQRLEITSEPLPGQPASTFSHFCILPGILFPLLSACLSSLHRPLLTEQRQDKFLQVDGWCAGRGRLGYGVIAVVGRVAVEERDGWLCQARAGWIVETLCEMCVHLCVVGEG